MISFLLALFLIAESPPSHIVGAAPVYPGGSGQYSLTGAGVTIGMWDLGVPLYTHSDFIGRTLFQRAGETNHHATAVAGVLNGVSVGLAPGAGVRPYLFTENSGADLDSIRLAASNGMRLSVHPYQYKAGWEFKSGGWASIGSCTAQAQWLWRGSDNLSETEDFQFGFYTQMARSWDAMLNDFPRLLPVVAAGNHRGAGPATQPIRHCYYSFSENTYKESATIVRDLNAGMTEFAVAKNVLTVGTWPNEATTSRGPTDDGRIKPDIVAPESVQDAPSSASDISYGMFSKTSAASSVAAGALALLHEHLVDVMGKEPLASTLKAMAIHTAEDKGDAGPDFIYGWGLMNLGKAVRTASLATVREDTLGDGQTHTFDIEHSGFGEVVVTLVWTDPEGEVLPAALNPTAPALVNDLDIRLLGVGGPYLPLTVGGGTSDNSIDNVEQIRVAGLAAGTYAISISHKGVLADAQAYSLIASSGDPQRRVFTLSQPGWRMVSIPFLNTPFSRISQSFTTQFGGGQGDPTMYRFSPSQTYVPVTDADTLTQPGRGYLLYVFDEDAPKEWIMNGEAVSSPVQHDLPWNGAATNSFLLAGNPFHGVLDWDSVVAASTGIASTYYVWDPSVTSGGGYSGFKHYTAGNPGTGAAGRYIPAFSGFFVFAAEPDAVIELDASALVEGAEPVFYGKEPIRYPHIRLSDGTDQVLVSIHPDAKTGWDRYDVPQLSRLDGRVSLSLLDEDGHPFRVMAIPSVSEPLRIRLSATAEILHSDVDAELNGTELVISSMRSTLPESVALLRAWPNPFNPRTTIRFIAEAHDIAHLRLVVIDMLGREVAVLVDGPKEPGEHSVSFDASKLASGVYLVRLMTDGVQVSLKLTLLK